MIPGLPGRLPVRRKGVRASQFDTVGKLALVQRDGVQRPFPCRGAVHIHHALLHSPMTKPMQYIVNELVAVKSEYI